MIAESAWRAGNVPSVSDTGSRQESQLPQGCACLAEIAEQDLPAATGRLAIADQRVEALMFAALAILASGLLVDEQAPHADVAEAEEQMRVRRPAVAPGTADLLVVGFEARRQIHVKHEAYVGLVDAHAERDGRRHDEMGLGHEAVLVRLARLLAHSGVIGERAHAVAFKKRRRLLGTLAREAIDDAAFARVVLQKCEQLAFRILLRLHREPDVGPVESEDDGLGFAGEKLFHDLGARNGVRSRGQRRDRHAREEIAQTRETGIVGAERRAPLRNAMRLVDGDQFHIELPERVQHALGHQPFGREIEQPRFAFGDAPPCRDIGFVDCPELIVSADTPASRRAAT